MTAAIELLMGIDFGMTNLKCCLYDTTARPVAIATRPARAARSVSGGVDLERLWVMAMDACAEAVDAARTGPATVVRGVAVSSAGCLPVLLDAADRPIRAAPSDSARLEALVRLAHIVPPAEYRRITGYPLDVHTAACRIAAVPARDRERTRSVVSIADFIAGRLTGQVVREFSTALSYGLWDYRKGTWWEDGPSLVGLDAPAFGAPVESGTLIGPLTREAATGLGLPQSTMVVTGGHDYLAAALAVDLRPGREILNVTGTYEILASLHGDATGVPGEERVRAIKDHHVVPGQYSHMVEAYGAGLVEWLKDTVAALPGEPVPDLDRWFAALDGLGPAARAAGALYVPPPVGALPTDRDPRAGGAFTGVRQPEDGALLFGALILGLCCQARQMLDRQRDVLGATDATIKAVGGGSRSPAWLQLKADVLGTPLRVPRITEASALGAALLAGVGAGVFRDVAEAATAAAGLGADTVEPDALRAAQYAELYTSTYLPLASELEAACPRLESLLAPHAGQA